MMKTTLAAVVLVLVAGSADGQHTCAAVGYYPDTADCTTFYRCTDLFGNGIFQQYEFMCPQGTVFDDNLDVCNWPWAVPSCGAAGVVTSAPTAAPTTTTAAPTTAAATTAVSTEKPYVPSENSPYTCTLPGIYGNDDCRKFWLCKEEPEGTRILEALLYRCPEGYLFSSATLRCKKEDDLSCVPAADSRTQPGILLTVDQLPSFFARWG